MSQLRKHHNIDYHTIEAALHHQNPVEGCIQELWLK